METVNISETADVPPALTQEADLRNCLQGRPLDTPFIFIYTFAINVLCGTVNTDTYEEFKAENSYLRQSDSFWELCP
jgi:hypothetical protein